MTKLMATMVLESKIMANPRQRKNTRPNSEDLKSPAACLGCPPIRLNSVVQCGQRWAKDDTD